MNVVEQVCLEDPFVTSRPGVLADLDLRGDPVAGCLLAERSKMSGGMLKLFDFQSADDRSYRSAGRLTRSACCSQSAAYGGLER